MINVGFGERPYFIHVHWTAKWQINVAIIYKNGHLTLTFNFNNKRDHAGDPEKCSVWCRTTLLSLKKQIRWQNVKEKERHAKVFVTLILTVTRMIWGPWAMSVQNLADIQPSRRNCIFMLALSLQLYEYSTITCKHNYNSTVYKQNSTRAISAINFISEGVWT